MQHMPHDCGKPKGLTEEVENVREIPKKKKENENENKDSKTLAVENLYTSS